MLLTEALAEVDRTGQHYYEAELYRLKGELTLQRFDVQSLTLKVTNSRRGIAHHEESRAEAETVGGAHPTAVSILKVRMGREYKSPRALRFPPLIKGVGGIYAPSKHPAMHSFDVDALLRKLKQRGIF
jgi:hypothetical protein